MGAGTSSGKASGTWNPSWSQRNQALKNMTFAAKGNGSQAIVPGVGKATVRYNATKGGYESEVEYYKTGKKILMPGVRTALASAEARARITLKNLSNK